MAQRDDVRGQRAQINARLKELDIDMEAERSKPGSNARTLTFDGLKLINDTTPRVRNFRLQVDDPPEGALNGSNTEFTLSDDVNGSNIYVIWHDSVLNQKWVLIRGNANPPLNHEFFFDNAFPRTIIVGNPPTSGDGLTAVFMVKG